MIADSKVLSGGIPTTVGNICFGPHRSILRSFFVDTVCADYGTPYYHVPQSAHTVSTKKLLMMDR